MSHRYNGNTIGNHIHIFIKTPSMISSVDQAIPIWDLIGISQQEYEIRFNMPITTPIEKNEVIEEVKEIIEEVIDEVIEKKETEMTEEIEKIGNEQTIEKVDEVEQILEEVQAVKEITEEPVKEIVEEPTKEIKDSDEVDLLNILPTETVEMSKEFLKTDLSQMEFEAKPSLIRKTRSLRFKQPEWI